MIKKWTAKKEEFAEPQKVGVCMAYGCPMFGTITSSTSGHSDSWLCHPHFRAEPSQWAQVTTNIKNNMLLANLVREIRLAHNGKQFDVRGHIASLKMNGHDDYIPCELDRRPNGTLSMRLWLSRLEKKLFSLSHQGLSMAVTEAKPNNNSELVMDMIDDFIKSHSFQRSSEALNMQEESA